MRRRDLIAFVGAASALASFAAQQPKMPTIGVLVVGSPASERFWRLFQQGYARARDQPEDGEGARPYRAAIVPRPRRRGDRIGVACCGV
jgi:hypothetical protein